jgi:RNase adaptor protein for sRNA GlmZ degradation
MTAILVTGMSGTGKSTALEHMGRRGHRVVDTDVGDWIEPVLGERLWREDLIDALLTEHEHSGEPLFVAGTVRNQRVFYPRFTEIVLLSAPLPVMLARIADRDTNPFGRTAPERAQIVRDTAEVEPLLRSSATVEIDTRLPLTEVVDRLAALSPCRRGRAGRPAGTRCAGRSPGSSC